MAVKIFLLWFVGAAVAAVLVLSLPYRHHKVHRALYKKLVTELQRDQQEEIVNAHNAFRRKVSPPAKNMVKMSWSLAAAENARILARYCDKAESDPLERRLDNTFCGENMHLEYYPFSWSKVIESWYNESKHFKYGEWPSTDDDFETEHYTQMVWASSYLIGCEVASCRRQNTATYLYVCHYCHEGNYPDMLNKPYKEGSPCGDCPDHCEDGLCIPLQIIDHLTKPEFQAGEPSLPIAGQVNIREYETPSTIKAVAIALGCQPELAANPCLYYDEYNNCDKQMRLIGCSHPSVLQFCKASCLCKTEIK